MKMAANRSYIKCGALLVALLLAVVVECQRRPSHVPSTQVLDGVQRFREALGLHGDKHRGQEVSGFSHGATGSLQTPTGPIGNSQISKRPTGNLQTPRGPTGNSQTPTKTHSVPQSDSETSGQKGGNANRPLHNTNRPPDNANRPPHNVKGPPAPSKALKPPGLPKHLSQTSTNIRHTGRGGRDSSRSPNVPKQYITPLPTQGHHESLTVSVNTVPLKESIHAKGFDNSRNSKPNDFESPRVIDSQDSSRGSESLRDTDINKNGRPINPKGPQSHSERPWNKNQEAHKPETSRRNLRGPPKHPEQLRVKDEETGRNQSSKHVRKPQGDSTEPWRRPADGDSEKPRRHPTQDPPEEPWDTLRPPRVPEIPNHLPMDLINRLKEFPSLAESLEAAQVGASMHSFFEPRIQVEAEELTDEEWEEYLVAEWTNEGIVPDLLANHPPYLANLKYPGGHCVHLGTTLTPALTRTTPESLQFPGEAREKYTILLLDLDSVASDSTNPFQSGPSIPSQGPSNHPPIPSNPRFDLPSYYPPSNAAPSLSPEDAKHDPLLFKSIHPSLRTDDPLLSKSTNPSRRTDPNYVTDYDSLLSKPSQPSIPTRLTDPDYPSPSPRFIPPSDPSYSSHTPQDLSPHPHPDPLPHLTPPSESQGHRIRPRVLWLVINAPVDQPSKGTSVMEYSGPGPEQGTGPHRLVLLVYRQRAMVHSDRRPYYVPQAKKCQREGRDSIDLSRLTLDLDLEGPVAGNYFKAEWDITVEHACPHHN